MPVSKPDPDFPEPEVCLVLLGSLTRCFVKRLPKRERLEFLADVTADLRWLTEDANVIRIRPASQDKEVAAARRKAAAWWERVSEKLAELAR
jgi:hypothetical protein